MNHIIMGIERNNYDISKIGKGYLTTDISIEELGQSGCNMVKLFVFYQPGMDFTDEIDQVIAEVVEKCNANQLPLMLEPILYQSTPENRLELTKKMLTRLKKFDIDIYKIDFPGDLERKSDQDNLAICREINDLLATPWIILSSGVTLDQFKKQLQIAGQAGAAVMRWDAAFGTLYPPGRLLRRSEAGFCRDQGNGTRPTARSMTE